MEDQYIESERSTDVDEMEVVEDNLQKPNIFNKYLPFYDTIKRQGYELFDEIRENLSRVIQLRELRPGFSHWSSKLQRFISLYGLYFTKADHIKLIQLYISILSIPDLDFSHVKTCFDMLYDLMRLVFSSTTHVRSYHSFTDSRLERPASSPEMTWQSIGVSSMPGPKSFSTITMNRIHWSPCQRRSLSLLLIECWCRQIFVEISRILYSIAFDIAVRISLPRRPKRFSMSFDPLSVRSIRHSRIRCVFSNCSCLFICRQTCTNKDSSMKLQPVQCVSSSRTFV